MNIFNKMNVFSLYSKLNNYRFFHNFEKLIEKKLKNQNFQKFQKKKLIYKKLLDFNFVWKKFQFILVIRY